MTTVQTQTDTSTVTSTTPSSSLYTSTEYPSSSLYTSTQYPSSSLYTSTSVFQPSTVYTSTHTPISSTVFEDKVKPFMPPRDNKKKKTPLSAGWIVVILICALGALALIAYAFKKLKENKILLNKFTPNIPKPTIKNLRDKFYTVGSRIKRPSSLVMRSNLS